MKSKSIEKNKFCFIRLSLVYCVLLELFFYWLENYPSYPYKYKNLFYQQT